MSAVVLAGFGWVSSCGNNNHGLNIDLDGGLGDGPGGFAGSGNGSAGGTQGGKGNGNGTQGGPNGGGTSGGGTNGGGGTSGGAGANGGGGTSGGAGQTGTAGAGGSASYGCKENPSACSDGKDNDGDGLIDAADPECSGPCDNDEGTFATGIPGDNVDACKQDCFFDGNSGMGDDGCEWNLKCDPANPGAHAAKACEYNPNYHNCPATQSDQCKKSCQKLTPNGCDCFGCCNVVVNGQPANVLLVPSCKASLFGDPNACPRCTQQASCANPCDKCEVCIGHPMPDPSCNLPPPGTPVPPGGGGGSGGSGAGGTSGTGGAPGTGGSGPPPNNPCAPGVVYCGNNPSSCPNGTFCLTGCCLIP
jgi:hypothetical protein